jgi:putative flippase GtrA
VISRKRFHEIARYGVTGALCVLLNVVGVIVLTEVFGLHYLVSLTLCSALVVVVGFVLNRSWTFRKRGTGVVGEFVRYALATAVNVVIGLGACAFLVEELHISYWLSVAIVGVVFAPMTFLVHRAWTFGLTWLYGE